MQRIAVLLVALAFPALTGCGVVSSGTPEIKPDELERVVAERLEKQTGRRPDAVDCPDPLDGERGATTRCTLTIGPADYGVTLTTTDTLRGQVVFGIEVDRQPS